jgi:hypothetical protein
MRKDACHNTPSNQKPFQSRSHVTATAFGDTHRLVERPDAVPFPAFLQDLLQDTQFPVDRVVGGHLSSNPLVIPEVTDVVTSMSLRRRFPKRTSKSLSDALSWDAASWHVSKAFYASVREINNAKGKGPQLGQGEEC